MRRSIDISYASVRRVVGRLVYLFVKQYFLSPDEAWSAAGLGFCQAYYSYDKAKGTKFKTWVYEKVERRLTDLVIEKMEERDEPVVGMNMDLIATEEPEFNPLPLYDRLTDDGVAAVMLVLRPLNRVRRRAEQADGRGFAVGLKRAVKEHLRSRGWSRLKVERVFASVRRSL